MSTLQVMWCVPSVLYCVLSLDAKSSTHCTNPRSMSSWCDSAIPTLCDEYTQRDRDQGPSSPRSNRAVVPGPTHSLTWLIDTSTVRCRSLCQALQFWPVARDDWRMVCGLLSQTQGYILNVYVADLECSCRVLTSTNSKQAKSQAHM